MNAKAEADATQRWRELRKRHAEEGKVISGKKSPKSKAKKDKLGRRNEGRPSKPGGIPGKIAARPLSETRAKTTARTRKHKGLSVPRAGTDKSKGSGNVIPWPKEIKKPKRDTSPMGDKLEGRDREENAGL